MADILRSQTNVMKLIFIVYLRFYTIQLHSNDIYNVYIYGLNSYLTDYQTCHLSDAMPLSKPNLGYC